MKRDQDLLLAACKIAVREAGGPTKLSKKLGITSQGVCRWFKLRHGVPARHVLAVEKASGISRYVLRPDLYGEAPPKPPKLALKEEENGVPA